MDRDSKFVQEVQTTYNFGFWELYLFAVFKELGIAVDFSHAAPDFVAQRVPLVVGVDVSPTDAWSRRAGNGPFVHLD